MDLPRLFGEAGTHIFRFRGKLVAQLAHGGTDFRLLGMTGGQSDGFAARPGDGGCHQGLVHIRRGADRAFEFAARRLLFESSGIAEPTFEMVVVFANQGVLDHDFNLMDGPIMTDPG